jgi:hypothetical protein
MIGFDETGGAAVPLDFVTMKIVNAGTFTIDVTSNGTASVDIVDALTAGSLTSDAGLTLSGGTISMTHTAPEIFITDSTTSGEAKIAISDGAGPDTTMALQVDIDGTLTTLLTLDGANEKVSLGKYLDTFELGHASDTTIARTSAGVVNIEGKDIYMVGGTDVADADVVDTLTIATSVLGTFTGGLTLGADDDPSNVIIHSGSTIQIYDDSDDVSVTIGPVQDGIAVLDVNAPISTPKEVIADADGIILTAAQMNSVVLMTGAGEVLLPDVCDSATGQWVRVMNKTSPNQVEVAVADTANDKIVLIDGTALDINDEADLGTGASNWAQFECLEANTWYITAGVGVTTDGGAAD